MKIGITKFGKYGNVYRLRFHCDEINTDREYFGRLYPISQQIEAKSEFWLICNKAESDFAYSRYKEKWKDFVKYNPVSIDDLWESVKDKIFLSD